MIPLKIPLWQNIDYAQTIKCEYTYDLKVNYTCEGMSFTSSRNVKKRNSLKRAALQNLIVLQTIYWNVIVLQRIVHVVFRELPEKVVVRRWNSFLSIFPLMLPRPQPQHRFPVLCCKHSLWYWDSLFTDTLFQNRMLLFPEKISYKSFVITEYMYIFELLLNLLRKNRLKII